MKNIWIFNQYNMPPEYGHLNRHFNFGKYLKRAGYNPVVYVGSNLHNSKAQMIQDNTLYKIYEDCEYPYVFVKTCDYSQNRLKRVYAMFEFYRCLYKVTRKFDKPDVIIGSSAHPLAAIAAIKLAKKYGCQSIVEVRDLWPESFVAYGVIRKSNPLLKLLYAGEKWIYKKADKLIFTMEGGKDYVIEKHWDMAHGGPINLDKVYHINNGVDLAAFKYNKENYSVNDTDLDNESNFKVIYTGSIRKANNVQILVDVAKEMQIRGYNKIKIIVYGDGDNLEQLRKYALENSIENIIFKGKVDKKFIPFILSKCDLSILDLCQNEIFRFGVSPNKLFDYFASGKPILSIEYNHDLVKKYQCGITIKSIDVSEIAEKIIYLYKMDNEQLKLMSENALKAAKDFDFKMLTSKLIELL